MFGWGKRRAERIAAKFAELDRIGDRLDDAWGAMLADRPPASAAGVDLAPVTAADPAFDGHAFLAIARESYFKMRDAWERRNASMAVGLCTPQMMAALQETVAADAAAQRRHLLPGIEIRTRDHHERDGRRPGDVARRAHATRRQGVLRRRCIQHRRR